MPTVKTVDVGFAFVYVDKRRKYTSKDFGLKSIPYGESEFVHLVAQEKLKSMRP